MTTLQPSPPLRVAVVGCGAVARANLLPVLAGHDRLAVVALVDRDEARARALAQAYGVARVLATMDSLTSDVADAVILATPPAHHAPATIALAARGLHVFVEKPMATNTVDAEAMVAAADGAGVMLAVGLYRRMLPAVQLLKRLLATEEYGAPLSVDIAEGGPYGWQLATLDVLTAAQGGGGVLIDIGSHVIDVLLYVLPGEATLTSYRDNSRGGIETDCVAEVNLATPRGPVPVRLELSRTRELRGSIRVVCERATVELMRGDFTRLVVHRAAGDRGAEPGAPIYVSDVSVSPMYSGYHAFRAQIDAWIEPMLAGRDLLVSGRSVVPVVRLIEQCYRSRAELVEPWTDEGLKPGSGVVPPGPRRRVLVTGAGGFLGARTVELLRGRYGWDVVALVKEPKGAARLARWPTEIVLGDVCSAPDMERALRGCDAVVHCAVGTSWDPAETRRVTIEGTRTVAAAAHRAGVKRFVHISSMFVHRRDGSSRLDESTPLDPPQDDAYGQAKLAAERALDGVVRRGLSAIVLRPTRIYGPLSKTFTVRPLQALAEGRFAIGGDPEVPANMVYVDNVVAAIASALDAPDSLTGQAYLVNDPDQLSLRSFYEFFASPGTSIAMVPASAGASAPRRGLPARVISSLSTIVLSPELRALVHRIMDADAVGALPRWLWGRSPDLQRRLLRLFRVDAAVVYRPPATNGGELLVYSGQAGLVSSDKAARELGLVPAVAPPRAMALTLEWARSAGQPTGACRAPARVGS